MPTFTNLDDIKKYIKKNVGTVKLTNGKNLNQIMQSEAKRLKDIITKHIGIHYASYSNNEEVRSRTFGLINSLRVETIKQVGSLLSVKVYFDQDMATQPSVVGGEPGFTPILIDQGWEVKADVWFKDIPMFGHFDGTGFIKSAVMEYNSKNPYGLSISVEYTPNSNLNFTV